ncbi:NADH-quinone oxidoreductase subunit C [Pyrococcus yayanosii]|uniref:Membrane bound hydrogenase, NiFe-hydrogenase large subunit 1 n=1 Tax=Pyrococcus yayanosii (strain CH1 / JCM 16557) TaxID=529709 RepID=F8AEX7_PYRYC|nr:NADH-quinone oxidoreductase subunit C [Pyrococcus yayanosii]AEH24814.1 membrane bound hydrogenase, NiFe-hydrogenase large subunit 1 [Pyrococcus yayanosii CH1]
MSDANPTTENVEAQREPTKEEKIAEMIKAKFPRAEVEVRENKWGRKRIGVSVSREDYKPLMEFLRELDPEAHYSIAIEEDLGEELGLATHLLILYEDAPGVSLIVKTKVPKEDPVLPDVSDVYPIALQFERECMEMIGLDFEGAPDKRRLFLPDDFPEDIYPLRLDEKGISEEIVKNAGHPYLLRRGST